MCIRDSSKASRGKNQKQKIESDMKTQIAHIEVMEGKGRGRGDAGGRAAVYVRTGNFIANGPAELSSVHMEVGPALHPDWRGVGFSSRLPD